MKFEVSEQIRTGKDVRAVLDALEVQLRKVSKRVDRSGNVITATAIEASFGSINRSDRAVITAQPKDVGILCIAEVTYKPSVAFWIIFILCLFTYVLWLLPIIFYLTQKKTVRAAIADVFVRVKNEFEMARISNGTSALEELERLAVLKEKGNFKRH